MKIFEEIESEVQSYARSFPRLFNRAKDEFLASSEKFVGGFRYR